MTEALYIRLAGPLQSWAGPAITGNFVRTEPRPTRSGLVGLLAGACGYGRGEYPEWLTQLHFQIREDNRGTLGQRPTKKLLNSTPDGQGLTAITERTYIADGEFIVQIKAGSREHQELLAEKLQQPHFVTYLGRKAFAPSFPFYLGVGPDDILARIPTVGGEEPKKILRFYALGDDGYTTTTVPVVKDRKQWLTEVSKIF